MRIRKAKVLRHRLAWAMPLLVLAFFVVGSLAPERAFAATRTWDGGCGVDTSWSCDANWSLDTEPVAADTVVFDNTSDNNSTIDATFTGTVAVININAGYDGTITMARSFTVSTTFSQASGSFTAADQTLDINGTFTTTAGSFTASSGAMTAASTFSIAAGTFTHNSGTLTFDGSAGTSPGITCNSNAFNLVTFTHSAGTKIISSTCSLPLGNNPSIGSGTAGMTISGTLSGTGTINYGGTTQVTYNSTAVLSGFSAMISNGGASLVGASFDWSSYTTVDLNTRGFSMSSGAVFTAPSGTMTVGGGLNLRQG